MGVSEHTAFLSEDKEQRRHLRQHVRVDDEAPMPLPFELDFLSHQPIGQVAELPSRGSPLSMPRVFDAAAQALKALADPVLGLLEIVEEHHDMRAEGDLITALSFRRLR